MGDAFAAELQPAKILPKPNKRCLKMQNYCIKLRSRRTISAFNGVDTQMNLLTRTQASYEEFLTLTRNRFNAGVASDLDVAQAETQLYSVESQKIDLGVQRAQLEHAIAVLVGKAPADLSIPEQALATLPPPVPVGVPSELLQRRPDIAAAERSVAAANEQIGIAIAAFYPSFTLGVTGGLQTSSVAKWFTWPSRFWSVGPQLSETLFDAGRRRSIVAGQQAAYDSTVAAYRETALTAMQQVEDNLAALRILEEEAAKVQQTIDASQRALEIASNQYGAGTVSYLNVITAQGARLAAERTQVQLQTRRLNRQCAFDRGVGRRLGRKKARYELRLQHSCAGAEEGFLKSKNRMALCAPGRYRRPFRVRAEAG